MKATNDSAAVDAYLSAQPPGARTVLARVRAAIKRALPRATERISYRIPVYEIDGTMVLYFAGFAKHWSIYPATKRLVRELEAELAERLHSKGTLRFSYDERFPAGLIARIARARAAEVADLRLAKAKKKTAKKKTVR